MHTFFTLLKAETLKSRNSFAVWLSIAGTIGNMFVFFALNWFNLGQHTFGSERSDWETYVLNHYDGIAFMMLPLYVIILATLLTFMEHRPGTWAQLMSLPEKRSQVYASKLTFGLLLFIAAHLVFMVGLLLTGWLLGLLHKDYIMPLGTFPAGLVLTLGIKTIFSILALLALHFWISLRFPHFIVPLTIGILGFVFTSILTPAFPFQWLNPYAYPICYMPDHLGAIDLPAVGFFSLHDGMSLLLGVVFLFVGMRQAEKMAFA